MRFVASAFLLSVTVLGCARPVAAQQEFQGKLSDRVRIFSDVLGPVNWRAATAEERKGIPESLSPADQVLMGSLDFGGNGGLQFPAALVKKAGGDNILYVDQGRDGRFTADERHVFEPPPGKSKAYPGTVELNLPLSHGPYATMPAVAELVPSNVILPPGMHRPDLLVGNEDYVEGTVEVESRPIEVRFQFDPASGSVDLSHAAEWMSLQGTGKFDYLNNRQVPHGQPPVFHIGTLYLRVAAIDPRAGTFTVRTVPASDYTRIDWTEGSVLPDFAWTGFDGTRHRFSAVKGKYRLIDFWATWCVPCVADLTAKKASYEKFHARGFEILSIDGDATQPEAAQRMMAEKGITWPQARYDRHLVQAEFGVSSWPTLILVDRNGKVVSASNLDLYGAALDRTLNSLLPASAAQ